MPQLMLLAVVAALPVVECRQSIVDGEVERNSLPSRFDFRPSTGIVNQPTGPLRPALTVWTSAACVPCRDFWQDLHTDVAFRSAVLSHFNLRWVDADRHPAAAAALGIDTIPTFEVGTRRIEGYAGKEWLWRNLTTAAEGSSSSTRGGPGTAQPHPGESLELPPPLTRHRAPPVLDDNSPPTREEGTIDAAGTGVTAPVPLPPDSHATRPSSRSRSGFSDLASWLHHSAPLVLTGLELAGLLGGSAATGGIGALALAVLWRWFKRRRRRRHDDTPCRRNGSPFPSTTEEANGAAARAPFPRRLDEARELLALRQSEGRVAVLDALRGMFLDDELAKLSASASAVEGAILDRLRTAIDTRVNDVAPLSTTIDERSFQHRQ